ncbi:Putative acyl-[acyl-carrier-protein] desaturase DesA1 [Dyadobacter sp. CECT 9275]|uniref:Acyl-[acyl-carrier-protein] desaturase DesA1 n=1 Tax=Dyadobacter helix TaxID=2822344 RepID=A0A916NL64_9BACT|nr:acyl-ACP desaturase [Dyadobacter sp. CECT 9275]CAG4999213.1 Putative acyl-[acyl-carrier-protein] desaturase DesA1 [Dyadobacter sp. CECT 9275]
MDSALSAERLEVMQHVGKDLDGLIAEYLRPIEDNWQPSDFLPDASSENFISEVKLLQESCMELPYDYIAVLIGDTITEEALPTYESWLADVIGVNQVEEPNGWMRWVRAWTAEENRHGDLLNKYLYLSGRVNMRAMEVSTQYLIADGFDIGTDRDPYRNFIYTSFQELATNVSHRRTATLAKKFGNPHLSKICGVIASDEMRHAKAYKAFVTRILAVDPSELILALEDMMRKKIVMPAHFLRETGVKMGDTFSHFSDAAQRLGVYTTNDYIEILDSLLIEWEIETVKGLNEKAEKARDYLMALPARLLRIAERTKIPDLKYEFSWIR